MLQNQQSLLELLKENKASDKGLLSQFDIEIGRIKRDLPNELHKENIFQHLLLRDRTGKNIFDYCAINDKVDLFKKILEEIPVDPAPSRFYGGFSHTPLSLAIIHNSYNFLEYLFASNITFPHTDITGGRNILHLSLSDEGFLYKESVYKLSEQEITKKMMIAELLLDKVDKDFLHMPDQDGSNPLYYLYRFNPPEFIVQFTDLMREKGIEFDISKEEKSTEIFRQLTAMKEGNSISNSRKIELIKLIGDEECEVELLKQLFSLTGSVYFEKKDQNQQSLFDLMQRDHRMYQYLDKLFTQDSSANLIESGNASKLEIWNNWKSSSDLKETIKALDIDTLLERNGNEKSLWHFILMEGDHELLDMVIDKMDIDTAKTVKESLKEPTITCSLTFDGELTDGNRGANFAKSSENINYVNSALERKIKSQSGQSDGFSCLSCLRLLGFGRLGNRGL